MKNDRTAQNKSERRVEKVCSIGIIKLGEIGISFWVGIERKKKIQEVEKMIQRAIAFATKAHDGQLRKGTMRPYILHPLEVGVIVARMTEDEEVISAAILHDTIEDCEGVTAQMIEQMFSKRVAELVQKESEDKSKTWMERKGATIQHLKVAEREVQMIGLADKLSNIRDIDRDYPECGEELWQRFRMKDKETIGWYYKGVEEALRKSFSEVPVYIEYRSLVEKIFGK